MADSDQRARRRGPGKARSILWGGAGALAGGLLEHDLWGLISGGAIGSLIALWMTAAGRANARDSELEALDTRLRAIEAGAVRPATPAPPLSPPGTGPAIEPPVAVPPAASAPAGSPSPAAERPSAPSPRFSPPPPRPLEPSGFDRALAALREVFLGGNTVVRVGVLVLLVGVVLLAKWAADNALFPIEARLAISSLIGVGLTVVGFRLRESRPGFGTSLQGGGIAALYLVVFIALRVFELLPPQLAFLLFVAIAFGGGALAVLQSSQPLIFIGSLGGFLAPVVASTGQGDHVVLFSYYLLLNLAIAAVAWFRAWRALNVLAFVCTYGIATAWGVLRYRPEQFASTEPFLLAYLALFTGVAVVYSWRRPPHLAGIVDGTLVFGTALVTLLAQARLVEGMEFGMAWSSAGLGLFYAVLASGLWRAAPDSLRRLCEAFIALAIGFGTLAIPFALDDGLTTTMVWALEGAGLYWVGTRQDRKIPRYAGIALQALAAMAFLVGTEGLGHGDVAVRAVANARFFACTAMSFAGFFIAREAWAARDRLDRAEWWPVQVLAGWALLWWVGGGVAEIEEFVATRYEISAFIGLIAATALAQELVGARLAWLPGRLLSAWSLPAGFVALALALATQPHLLASWGIVAWPFLLATIYGILHRLEASDVGWTRTAYAPAFSLLALVVALGLQGVTDQIFELGGDWPIAAFGFGLAAVLIAGRLAVEAGLGPFGRHAELHLRAALAPAAGVALLWIAVLSLLGRGNAAPLPYLPLLSPIDLASAGLAIAAIGWWLRLTRAHPDVLRHPGSRSVVALGGAVGFLWLNALLARSVHQWTEVAFEVDALWNSVPFQMSLSITWTLVALAGMWTSTRRRLRPAWITFASLLGVVVLKLFIVDLSQLSTGAKIGTFLVVGILLLVVGYLSPVPPAGDGEDLLAEEDRS